MLKFKTNILLFVLLGFFFRGETLLFFEVLYFPFSIIKAISQT